MPGRRVVFDSTLYLEEAVNAALDAYRDHASITVRRTPNGIAATFENASDEIVHAFCNHALFETVARRKQASLEGR